MGWNKMPTLESRVERLETQMNGALDAIEKLIFVLEELNRGLHETNGEIAKIREVIKKE